MEVEKQNINWFVDINVITGTIEDPEKLALRH